MKRKSGIKKLIISIIVILCLGGIAAYLTLGLGLFNKEDVTEEETRTYTVAIGDLQTDISAAGNLAFAETGDVTVSGFCPAGIKGTIEEVLVDVGDTVTSGQALATVDGEGWSDQIATLGQTITAKERALLQAQINLISAEQSIKSATGTITSRETAVISANITYNNAVSTLNSAITTVDFISIVGTLNAAQTRYDYVSITIPVSGTMKQADWEIAMLTVTEALAIAQADYDNALAGYSSPDVTLKKQQAAIAKANLDAAEQAVIDAREDVALKQMSLTLTQGNLEDAEQALADARANLAEMKKTNLEIIAPIDGLVTQVSISKGSEVIDGMVVMQITGTEKYKVELSVSEVDIVDVKVGGTAYITVDTLDVTLPATVTYISPSATIQSGVVNYTVRVELQELNTLAMPTTTGNFRPRSFNTENMTAPPSGANMTLPEGFSGQPPMMTMEDIKLRQGLTVTVSLVTSEAADVLLVPYAGVTTENRQKYVEVLNEDGTTEKRAVTTGITDYSYIVITDGLAEGEQIVIPTAAAATPNSFQGFQQGGIIFDTDMGGMGGPPSGGGFPGGQ